MRRGPCTLRSARGAQKQFHGTSPLLRGSKVFPPGLQPKYPMAFRSIPFALALVALAAIAPGQSPQPGMNVFQPNNTNTAYAVDLNGNIVHSWPGTAAPALAAYMAANGDLVRTRFVNNWPTGGGVGGGLERVGWDGQVLWSFQYSTTTDHTHHDIALMPNGNVLMIAWRAAGGAAAVAAGRNPATVGTECWAETIIEVQPDGNGGANVVWEWSVMDHLVQNFDSNLPNFGAPSDFPERIDVNFGTIRSSGDWMHCNGIDYNEELDQIVISARSFNEIWIIDHGTTTAQAAGSTGGLRGKGGDLLYRWGNPLAYGRGTAADQTLFGQHDSHWIAEGKPGAGNLLVFNNGPNRPGGDYSSADEIVAPLNASGTYDLLANTAFGPASAVSSSFHPNPMSFYSPTTSGCDRLANGNTMMVEGDSGFFIEIDPAGQLVWSWQNNLGNSARTFKSRRHAGGVTGIAYCDPGVANSTGSAATLRAVGSTIAAQDSLSLWAEGLPLSEFGFFLNGTGNAVTPMPGGSAGNLCLSQSLGRHNRLHEIFFSGSTGTGSLALDLNDLPTPGGPVSVLAGQTWYFQCWYRDTPAATSNFTNGVEVTFQ